MLWKKGKDILGETVIEIKRSYFNTFIYILYFIFFASFWLSINSFFDLKYLKKSSLSIEKELVVLNENIDYLNKELEKIEK